MYSRGIDRMKEKKNNHNKQSFKTKLKNIMKELVKMDQDEENIFEWQESPHYVKRTVIIHDDQYKEPIHITYQGLPEDIDKYLDSRQNQ